MIEAFEPEITILYCGRTLAANCYLPEGWMAGANYKARYIKLPCSSKIEPLNIMKLFERGIDGVLVIACPHQDCQFLFGDIRAESRIRYVHRLLDEVGLGGTRVSIISRTNLSQSELQVLAEDLAAVVRQLGPNPMKKSLAGSA